MAVAPPSRTNGDCASWAFLSAVIVLVTPGPAVTTATPGVAVRREVASAANAAVASSRTSTTLSPAALAADEDGRHVTADQGEHGAYAARDQHVGHRVAAVSHGFTRNAHRVGPAMAESRTVAGSRARRAGARKTTNDGISLQKVCTGSSLHERLVLAIASAEHDRTTVLEPRVGDHAAIFSARHTQPKVGPDPSAREQVTRRQGLSEAGGRRDEP